LREIERIGLNRKIEDATTDDDRKYLASIRRDRTIIELGEIMVGLQELRESHARDLELTPRADLN
jgi:hypothetical protein